MKDTDAEDAAHVAAELARAKWMADYEHHLERCRGCDGDFPDAALRGGLCAYCLAALEDHPEVF